MSDEAAFLRAIIAEPDDDAPRLVFADWLDDHGEHARAEFIRAQCVLESLPDDDPRGGPLAARVRALLRANGSAWLGPLRGLPARCRFRRGFVEEAELISKDFAVHAATLFAAAPLRRLSLSQVRHPIAGGIPPTVRLRGLSVTGRAADQHLLPVLGDPFAAELRELRLADCRLDGGGLARLFGVPWPAIVELALERGGLMADGIAALADWPGIGQLRSLDLTGNAMYAIAAFELERLVVGSLRRLVVAGCSLAGHPLRALADSSFLAQLDELDVGGNGLRGPEWAEFLPALPAGGLTALAMDGFTLDARGTAALVAWPGLARLRRLTIHGSARTDAHVALAAACAPGSLTFLSVAGPDGNISPWWNSPAVTGLRELRIAGTLTEELARSLLASSALPGWLLVRASSVHCPTGLLDELCQRFDLEA